MTVAVDCLVDDVVLGRVLDLDLDLVVRVRLRLALDHQRRLVVIGRVVLPGRRVLDGRDAALGIVALVLGGAPLVRQHIKDTWLRI